MKLVLAAVALLSLVAGHAHAGSGAWTPSSVNDNFIRGVDLGSVRATGDIRTFWAVSVYARRHDFAGEDVDYVVIRYAIDCAAQTVSTLYLTGYLADGTVVFSSDLDGDPSPILPDSMSEGEMETVCEGPVSKVRHGSISEFFDWARAEGVANWH